MITHDLERSGADLRSDRDTEEAQQGLDGVDEGGHMVAKKCRLAIYSNHASNVESNIFSVESNPSGAARLLSEGTHRHQERQLVDARAEPGFRRG